MWLDYTVNYIKKNKAASVSIMVAVFIAALFISALCSLFYNIWTDGIRRIVEEEGGWHARLAASVSEADIERAQSRANVKSVVITKNGAEFFFEDVSAVYADMPEIAGLLRADEEQIEYHNNLLARHFVFPPGEKAPLLWEIYAVIILMACFSLILIIRSAFQFSMNARIRQLGILHSVGATPGQIRLVLVQEALALSTAPVLLGIVSGIGVCIGFLQYANSITAQLNISGAVFEYHYLIFVITAVLSLATVLLSAWLPARKLSRLSPLEAVKGGSETPVKRMRKFRLTSLIFGAEGELSRKSFYSRRGAFRTASICLTVSFLAVSMFLVIMTLSELSTNRTYWERYKDAWDIMVEIKNPDRQARELTGRLRSIDGVDTLVSYHKNTAYALIPEHNMSDEVIAAGGYGALNRSHIPPREGAYLVETAIVVLDNESYAQYAAAAHGRAESGQGHAVVVNSIWDSKNSRYSYEEYVPFLRETAERTFKLFSDPGAENSAGEMIICAYAGYPPKLREEYKNYSLVQVISQDAYDSLLEKLPVTDRAMYISIRAVSEDMIKDIEERCIAEIGGRYDYTIENRPEKARVNAQMYGGYKSIMTAICALLACIGIANVFANTLGYVYQRKREFARYQSVGLTPRGINKMLFVEAFVIGVKPILISIPFNVLFILFAVYQSAIGISEFIANMPVIPTLAFASAILAAVGLSYYIGGRRMKNYSIVDALKNDALF